MAKGTEHKPPTLHGHNFCSLQISNILNKLATGPAIDSKHRSRQHPRSAVPPCHLLSSPNLPSLQLQLLPPPEPWALLPLHEAVMVMAMARVSPNLPSFRHQEEPSDLLEVVVMEVVVGIGVQVVPVLVEVKVVKVVKGVEAGVGVAAPVEVVTVAVAVAVAVGTEIGIVTGAAVHVAELIPAAAWVRILAGDLCLQGIPVQRKIHGSVNIVTKFDLQLSES